MMSNKQIFFGILLNVFLVGSANAVTYSFKTIDFPDATSTLPASINASGQVTGNYSGGAFLYSGGTFTNIDIIEYRYCGSAAACPFHLGTTPHSINDLGQVVGSRSSDSHNAPGGFLYSGGTFTFLGINGLDINNSGQAVGYYLAPTASGLYSGGNTTTIQFPDNDPPSPSFNFANGINANGQVVGTYVVNTYLCCKDDGSSYYAAIAHGFVFSGGTYKALDVPNATDTYGSSINASGQVAGYYTDGTGINHGYVYSGGAFHTFDVPGSIYAPAHNFPFPDPNLQINDSGQVSGTFTDATGNNHGFVYSNGVVTTINIPNATATVVNDINAKGQLAGYYTDSTRTHGFISTPVLTPKPKSKKDCADGGWKKFGFKSKEKCVRFAEKKKH